MSVDHGIYNQQDSSEQPIFLSVVPGMTVIVRHDLQTGEKADKDWWMGQVIHCGGAARDPHPSCDLRGCDQPHSPA